MIHSLREDLAVSLINSAGSRLINKQEFLLKLWLVLGYDIDRLCQELIFYGIDSGYFTYNEIKPNSCFYLRCADVDPFLPEVNQEPPYPILKENNWELFRLMRRMNGFFLPKTNYIFKDDVNKLIKDIVDASEIQLEQYIDEASYFGAVKCVKYLLVNNVTPSKNTFINACISGNEEIIQLLDEKVQVSDLFSDRSIHGAIWNWNNKLAKWMMDEKHFLPEIQSAIGSCNFVMFNYILNFDEWCKEIINFDNGVKRYKYSNDPFL